MNNRLIVFLILTLFALLPITAFSQNRNVYWVHGFGGDATAWQHYATIFANERKINSTCHSYNTTDGLDPAAAEVRNSVTNTSPTNIGIGHSMGGVMIREVDRMPIVGNGAAAKKFGGYITIASPNYGAPISANVINGNVNSVIATATNCLTAGPLAEFFGLPWTIISGWTTQKVTDTILEGVDFMSAATNNDLMEGSPKMELLNNNPDYTPVENRIAIIAEETSPVHWRMIGSMIWGAGSSGNPGDEQMVSLADQIEEVYNAMRIAHMTFSVLNPIAVIHHTNCAYAYKKGQDWMKDSETIWCNLIKSTRVETTTQMQWVWVNTCNNPKCLCKQMPTEEGLGNPALLI